MRTSSSLFFASLLLSSHASPVSLYPKDEAKRDVVTLTLTTAASPAPTAWDWAAGATNEWPIHPSCNSTERAQLARALDDTVTMARHAREHIMRYGNSSTIYRRYFGNASTGEPAGWFEKIVSGDRGDVLFRCDNIDGNCNIEGYGGHWRGSNATGETVICPLSYMTRRPLEALCGFGYTVAGSPLNTFFTTDLIHRMYHMPAIGEGVVEHYADSYSECLELAETNPQEAVHNTHSLQYFAVEAYAYDISLPQIGCLGTPAPESSSSAAAASPTPTSAAYSSAPPEPTSTTVATSEMSAASSVAATAAPVVTETATSTLTAPASCHTHADGEVHCV